MIYYLYKITNKVNGKIYVGVHKTKDIDDGYMGSGKVIRSAIEKYGLDNFDKTIMETFDSSEKMFAREKEIVTEEFLARDDVYNLRRGGSGGFDYINATKSEEDKRAHRSAGGKASGPISIRLTHEKRRKNGSYDTEKNIFKNAEFQQVMSNRSLTDEAKAKRKSTMAINGHSKGEKNSQFGSMWITNEIENKKVKKDSEIPSGYRRGRI